MDIIIEGHRHWRRQLMLQFGHVDPLLKADLELGLDSL